MTTAPRTSPTHLARSSATGLLVGALVLGPALAASAHVRVSADDPAAGGYGVLTFRVPNESDTAGTVSLAVDLPTDTPLTSVSVEPVPGWTAEVVRGELPDPVAVEGGEITEAPLSVTWTADEGVQIGPGEFQRFTVSAGPLPEEGTDVVLPATQTYSDGEVVAWDEPAVEGEDEPQAPAPVVTTTAAAGGDAAHAGHGAAAETDATPDTSAAASGAQGADTTARWLAGGGLALGLLALVVAVSARTSRGRVAR
ncbi:YcnI family protein [uncultured Pseudokineococcus sp.]|uniref:YcnI family copper-binding membrane protein n=1 Tax=uncultured Pseudokineococcus sp. TaxID=1642928 RepID=UPI0026317C9C|nr:YcnI family protein [uncultured Pseudokineococcus sp.]